MTTIIEAVYEDGVLKPLAPSELKERQHYRLILQEVTPPDAASAITSDPALAAEIERRTTVLPDGRKIIRLGGLFSADLAGVPEDADPVADALAELRRERAAKFDEEWPAPPVPAQEP
jgi:predicted DNA-binding antitoxin AbrB/MazE fold protein